MAPYPKIVKMHCWQVGVQLSIQNDLIGDIITINSQFVSVHVWIPSPKPLEGSSQNFQGLIRVPHCTSL